MRCNFCAKEIEAWSDHIADHLIVTKSMDGAFHTHGPTENRAKIKELVKAACQELDIPQGKTLDRKEIVFHNRQRIGDIFMFTCAVRDFKKAFPDVRVNVISTAGHIWDHNPNIDRTLAPSEENLVKIGPGKLTNASNRIDWHFANAFRMSMEDALQVSIPQGESRPDIYLTEEEFNAPRIMERPYWIICIGGEKGWGCKMYPYDRFQAFVDQNPEVMFVQIGTAEDNHPRLKGANVLDYIGKTQDRETGIRDLYKLFMNAEGSIGLVSFHMHLSGGLGKPCIVVAGAREPVSFTQYPGHRYLATDGALPCGVKACWHCDIKTCEALVNGIPKCVDLIKPEDLTRALRYYYDGGRCSKDKPIKKEFKNVVKAPVAETKKDSPVPVVEGFEYGGGSLTREDWAFLEKSIRENDVKSVLEFGAGFSTVLLNRAGVKVVTYETNQAWIDKVKRIEPKCDVRPWDGVSSFDPGVFDMSFVDGPAGGRNREISTRIASGSCRVVMVHDANREHERNWQEKYLKAGFKGPVKGGSRSHLWVKTAQNGAETSPGRVIPAYTGKHIKFVSTARGWGGCARSITTIMKKLLDAGHKVEFVPFRNAVTSREMQDWVSRTGIEVKTGYGTLKEHHDILVVYADDFVWEFKTPAMAEVFENVNADRKIMVLNYRRGGVGEIPWTKGWDKYLFLNSTQQNELLKLIPDARTKVLPPCTDLGEFFKVEPVFDSLKIVRHSSQGDTKFANPGAKVEIESVLESRQDAVIRMIPGPSFVPAQDRFTKLGRVDSPELLAKFLGGGSLFWYSLPKGYMDMGPRVILEAMAAGIPVLADNWGGAVDRVTRECGWLCGSKEEMLEVIKNVTPDELKAKGRAARERAKTFCSESWVDEIVL